MIATDDIPAMGFVDPTTIPAAQQKELLRHWRGWPTFCMMPKRGWDELKARGWFDDQGNFTLAGCMAAKTLADAQRHDQEAA